MIHYAYKRKFGDIYAKSETDETMLMWQNRRYDEHRKSNFKYVYAISWYRDVLVSSRGMIYVCFVHTSYVIFQNTYFLRFHVANLQKKFNPYEAYIVVSQLYR